LGSDLLNVCLISIRIENVNKIRYIACGMISSMGTGRGKPTRIGRRTVRIGMDNRIFVG